MYRFWNIWLKQGPGSATENISAQIDQEWLFTIIPDKVLTVILKSLNHYFKNITWKKNNMYRHPATQKLG